MSSGSDPEAQGRPTRPTGPGASDVEAGGVAGSQPGAHVLTRLSAVLDELAALDPATMADGASVATLHRHLARLDAATTRVVGCSDRERQWAADGARSAPVWLATRTGIPIRAARRRVRLARSLQRLPAAAPAWARGAVNADHVAALAAGLNDRTAEAMARDEPLLVQQASELSFRHWERALAYWLQLNDPDGTDLAALAQRDRRRFHLSETTGGWFAEGFLDPVAGAILADALGRIEDALWRADWSAARDHLGQGPTSEQLERRPAQRRADALVELARRALSAPADGRRPDPCLTVFVDYETLAGRICELAGGTVVAPAALLPWLDEAWVRRVVFDGPSRVFDVGADRRLFDGATRIAIAARDRHCYLDDDCHTPHRQLQVDHIVPWSQGGPTTVDNGRLACGHHNRRRNPRPPPTPP